MMEPDVHDNDRVLLNDSDERPRSAVNSVVLDYYKKFGRKRDLEQYFSLSTAQSDIRDPRSWFWRRMKEQSDASDSGEKKSESSNEICRISIKCSIPERPETTRDNSPLKSDSESPPIITDVVPRLSHSGDESNDDNRSQKSADETLDTSMNKPLSPTSSVTSQRKLEWDSLADVGYGNESDRKTSASSLSTLEREVLAQKQQYTLDMKQNSDLGLPTAHSTPVDPVDSKSKGKKGQGKKTTTFSKKDVEIVEFTVPQNDNTPTINVNLSKQFSVNLERDGGITVDNFKKDVTVTPEKVLVNAEVSPQVKMDKEIQTSLMRSKEKIQSPIDRSVQASTSAQKVPILICLNTLRRRQRRKKIRKLKTKIKSKKRLNVKKDTPEKEKSAEQVSEAESFEYMPGHMYNQNQLDESPNRHSNNNAGNKSSLESSAAHTTDSSKESKYSFTKDLENSLDVLKSALENRYDSNLKKKLVKDIIQRLLKSKYGDDQSTPDFISVLSLASNNQLPTTSTSDADNSGEQVTRTKPKKSILRVNKFKPNDIASTSQSVPNLPSVIDSEKPKLPYITKQVSSTTTDTELSANNSAKGGTSSDTVFPRTSSQELYQKYIDALKREEAYKQHLKVKELFLRQKLASSNNALKTPAQFDQKTNKRLKELIKDLTRNNYDDGSGDASKLEGGPNSNIDITRHKVLRKQRSHSVFTLSSGNSDVQSRKCVKSRDQGDNTISTRAGPSNTDYGDSTDKKHECIKANVTDSSVQVNIKMTDDNEKPHTHEQNTTGVSPEVCAPTNLSEEVKYVCLCTEKALASQHCPEEFMIYKCSRLTGQVPITRSVTSNRTHIECSGPCAATKNDIIEKFCPKIEPEHNKHICFKETSSSDNVSLKGKLSKTSQTNVRLAFNVHRDISSPKTSYEGQLRNCGNICSKSVSNENNRIIQEATRCLQTEISIHPKISDPSLSDINIIKSAECVKLICELYRKVSQSSSESKVCQCSSERDDAHTNMSCTSSKERGRDNYSTDDNLVTPLINQKSEKKPDLQCRVGGQIISTQQAENVSDNIVIPIQGTNMTLKVSIAGNSQNPGKNQTMKDIESQNIGIGTDKIENIENFTSVPEFSKAVQPKSRDEIDQNKCRFKRENNQALREQNKDLFSKPIQSQNIDVPLRNTYPKNSPVNESKPLLRSYTDAGNLRTTHGIQTDSIHNKDTQPRWPIKNPQNIANSSTSQLSNNTDLPSQKLKGTLADQTTLVDSQPGSKERNKNYKYLFDESTSLETDSRKSNPEMMSNMITDDGRQKDLILDMIQDITRRYSKKDLGKTNKRKCFKEIITVLNHLLDTDTDSGDGEQELFQIAGTSSNYQSSNNHYRDSEIPSYRQIQSERFYKKASEVVAGEKSPRKESKIPSKDKTDKGLGKSTAHRICRIQQLDKGILEALVQDADCESTGIPGTKETPDHSDFRKKPTSDSAVNTVSNDENNKFKNQPKETPSKQPSTCDKSCDCGCDGADCSENLKSHCKRLESFSSKNQETKEMFKNQPKETPSKQPSTCDKSCDCGCDGADCSENLESHCKKEESFSSKNQETKEKSSDNCSLKHEPKKVASEKPKTCDKSCSCGCENFDCGENLADSKCKESFSPKTPETDEKPSDSDSCKKYPKKTNPEEPSTCDKSCDCGCEGSDCREIPDSKCKKQESFSFKKPVISGNSSSNNDSENGNKKLTTMRPSACDKSCSCGCDGSDCGEKSKGDSKCSKKVGSSCPKKQDTNENTADRPGSKNVCNKGVSKQTITCDKSCSCGCDGSECNECLEDDLKFKSIRSKIRDESQKRPKTCDKKCGCDHSSDCKSSGQDCTACGTKSDEQISRCKKKSNEQSPKKFVSKCVQSTARKVKSMYCHRNDSSDVQVSTDQPCTSTDSPTARIINKIKKECEKYQKRCKPHCSKKCQGSSSTSGNCDHCNRVPSCPCKGYKCRGHRTKTTMEKIKRKCVAYNLILQTSDSMASEENEFDKHRRCLQNVVIKVPKCKQENIPFKELSAKIEQKFPSCSQRYQHAKNRSQSWPNESGISSTDDVKMAQAYTVRDYLERNRPDFVERCATRQNCIRMISDSRPECSTTSPRLKMVVIHNPNCMSCTGPNMYCGGVPMNYNCTDSCQSYKPCAPCDPCVPCDPCTVEKEITTIASERARQREMLSMQLGVMPTLTDDELRYLAKKIGLGRRQTAHPKIISEREMKQHSEKIYKSLPEVVQKKEDAKKESIKKTNLLMASIFKKNLQKKTLRGSVNLSNYNTVIKI